MFQTVPVSTIRSFSLYTQQWYMSYSLRAGSGQNWFRPDPARKLSADLYDIYHCSRRRRFQLLEAVERKDRSISYENLHYSEADTKPV